MAEKLSRKDLLQLKADRDESEAQLRAATDAARERFAPLNLTKEAAEHVTVKAKSAASATAEGAKKHKWKLIGGAVLASAALAYLPVKNLLAKRNPPS
ncbi:hypothetical protein [Alterisphingorhabdus coralli]|uniref:DUF3618 domain-containing protein n=1 Tax=Alterisphingorhabdus coralli TaxID=3071408 RepID=A0AA97HZQ5_9SPHN|nr:hypothetical protein [Parasphingorhabdus sp. SCSIO 66989]WOE74087.1 hypothetical protein RB602_09480 [Parasphingorhabdus sp. SCSIO 66989]